MPDSLLLSIFPYKINVTEFIIPTVEETLLGEYNRGKRLHKKLAKIIFRESVEESRTLLEPWLNHPKFNLQSVVYLSRAQVMEIDDWLNLPTDVERQKVIDQCQSVERNVPYNNSKKSEKLPGLPLLWSDQSDPAVFLRINCGEALGKKDIVQSFLNNHIIHGIPYKPLGKCYQFPDNIHTIQRKYQARPFPFDLLPKGFLWKPEEIVIKEADEQLEKYIGFKLETRLDYQCAFIARQCKQLFEKENDPKVRDALWFYHGCFLDYWVKRFKRVPLNGTEYPYQNRFFSAFDLPNLFHLLYLIPYWGELEPPATIPLAKFMQKCMPFAGARRSMISQMAELCKNQESFWRIFSACFYCLLIDSYPESLSKKENRCFDISKLVKMIDLATSKDSLIFAFTREGTDLSEKDIAKGCLVISVAFRMWFCMMAKDQEHFQKGLSNCLNWSDFEKQTIHMAEVIRQKLGESSDPFAASREILSNSSNNVYRYRQMHVIATILDQLSNPLEKTIYKRLEALKFDLRELVEKGYVPQWMTDGIPSAARIEKLIEKTTPKLTIRQKEQILNLLIRTKREDWLTAKCLSIMRIIANVSEHSIFLLLKMINVYYEGTAKPKEFEYFVGLFEVQDFETVCWYFQVINQLCKVEFELSPFQTDHAMIHSKYMLYPGQELPESAYDVFFTICCGKIKTLEGSREYGHENVAYDIHNGTFVCSKVQKKQQATSLESVYMYEAQKRMARNKRKEFNKIPCHDNPVLQINLKGFILIYEKTERYTHCPKCAGFHKMHDIGHVNDEYMCLECRQALMQTVQTCAVCGQNVGQDYKQLVMDPLSPNGAFDTLQYLYFCKKHNDSVAKRCQDVPKSYLFKKL